jgi:ABC-type Fe3+-hydroxamate transport system substrate-binding protein
MSFQLQPFCAARLTALLLVLSSFIVSLPEQSAYGRPDQSAADPSLNSGIACGTLACDEIVSALLDDGLPQEKVWAFSTLADESRYSNVHPRWQRAITNRFGEQIEGILKSRPTLVVLSSYSRSDYREALRRAGIAIMDLPAAQNLADIATNIEVLAKAIGYLEGGLRLSKQFRERIAMFQAICAKVQTDPQGGASPHRPHAVRKLLQFYPENGTMTGAGSTFSELASLACTVNATESMGLKGWPKLGLERLMLLEHDALVIATAKESENPLPMLQGHLQWRKLRSVAAGQVIPVPDRYLSSQSHHILESVQPIKAFLEIHQGPHPP